MCLPDPAPAERDVLAALKMAAQTPPELASAPLGALIDHAVEQLLRDLDPDDVDLELVELVRAAVVRGIELGNTRIGDLM